MVKSLDQKNLPFLELNLLRTFVAVTERGSFTKAALHSGLSTSAVSMQMKRLKSIVQRPLLARANGQVAPTAAGQVLLEYARKTLAENRYVMAKFVATDLSGLVRLGASEEYGPYVAKLVDSCSRVHPKIVIDVVLTRSSSLRKRLDDLTLDIALLSETSPDGLLAVALFTEPLIWASAKGGIAHLTEPLPVATSTADCEWRERAISALTAEGRDFRIVYEGGYTSGVRSAVQAGLAIAPLPRSVLTSDMIALGIEHGLPEIGKCIVSLYRGGEQTPASEIVAANIQLDFAFGTLPT